MHSLTGAHTIVSLDPTRTPEIEEDLTLHLSDTILGQEAGTQAIAQTLSTRIGMHSSFRKWALAVIMIPGPTGVGKTETMKQLSQFFFGKDDAFVYIKWEQFTEGHTVRDLLGAPKSYVGYSDKTPLDRARMMKPFHDGKKNRSLHPAIEDLHDFSLVLIDEAEKMHPDVRQAFLGMFSDGKTEFSDGSTVNFHNTVFVLTTNVGEWERKKELMGGVGFIPKSYEAKIKDGESVVQHAIERTFSQEFLGRIDLIAQYRPIDQKSAEEIVRRNLDGYKKIIRERSNGELTLSWEHSVETLIAQNGWNPAFGGRDLVRMIGKHVYGPLDRFFSTGQLSDSSNGIVRICAENTLPLKFELIPWVIDTSMSEERGDRFPRNIIQRTEKYRESAGMTLVEWHTQVEDILCQYRKVSKRFQRDTSEEVLEAMLALEESFHRLGLSKQDIHDIESIMGRATPIDLSDDLDLPDEVDEAFEPYMRSENVRKIVAAIITQKESEPGWYKTPTTAHHGLIMEAVKSRILSIFDFSGFEREQLELIRRLVAEHYHSWDEND